MNPSVTRQEYSLLKNNIVDLVQDLRSCEARLESVSTRIQELGITVEPIKDEGELAYLTRVATACNTIEHDLLAKEEHEALRADLGEPRNTASRVRRSKLGRFFSNLSALAG